MKNTKLIIPLIKRSIIFIKNYKKNMKLDKNKNLSNIDFSKFNFDFRSEIVKEIELLSNIDISYKPNYKVENDIYMDNIKKDEDDIKYLNRVFFDGENIIKKYEVCNIMDNIKKINIEYEKKIKNCIKCKIKLNENNKSMCKDCYIYERRTKEIFNKLLNKVKGMEKVFFKNIYLYNKLYEMYINDEINIECINYKTFEHKIFKKIKN